MKPDDSLIRPKIEDLREMMRFERGLLERRQLLRSHDKQDGREAALSKSGYRDVSSL